MMSLSLAGGKQVSLFKVLWAGPDQGRSLLYLWALWALSAESESASPSPRVPESADSESPSPSPRVRVPESPSPQRLFTAK
jgi:hypothetical protein